MIFQRSAECSSDLVELWHFRNPATLVPELHRQGPLPLLGPKHLWTPQKPPLGRERQFENPDRMSFVALVSELGAIASNDRFNILNAGSCQSAFVKSFGRREAYESRRGTNPRATGYGYGYGEFDLRLVLGMVRPPSESGGFDADRPLCLSATRYRRLVARPDATPSASMITMDTRGSVAGG